jgi:hypothetical protein
MEIVHGLLNAGDYVVLDILSSGLTAPKLTCSYRITEISQCAIRDESQSARENYVVGLKVNDNIAMTASVIAVMSLITVIWLLLYVVGGSLYRFIKFMLARLKVHSLEEALDRVYESGIWNQMRAIKIKEIAPYGGEEVKSFMDDPHGEKTLGEVANKM